jgi:hypothetical protein
MFSKANHPICLFVISFNYFDTVTNKITMGPQTTDELNLKVRSFLFSIKKFDDQQSTCLKYTVYHQYVQQSQPKKNSSSKRYPDESTILPARSVITAKPRFCTA